MTLMVRSRGKNSRSARIDSLVHQNQGGGDKKQGLPYQIGRDSWVSHFFNPNNAYILGKCCKLSEMQKMPLKLSNPMVRPVGGLPANYHMYPGRG